jgi:hypothetical protein
MQNFAGASINSLVARALCLRYVRVVTRSGKNVLWETKRVREIRLRDARCLARRAFFVRPGVQSRMTVGHAKRLADHSFLPVSGRCQVDPS